MILPAPFLVSLFRGEGGNGGGGVVGEGHGEGNGGCKTVKHFEEPR